MLRTAYVSFSLTPNNLVALPTDVIHIRLRNTTTDVMVFENIDRSAWTGSITSQIAANDLEQVELKVFTQSTDGRFKSADVYQSFVVPYYDSSAVVLDSISGLNVSFNVIQP